MLGGNYQPIPELLPTRPFSLPLPLLPRTFQQVWIRNDIPGNGTEEKQRGKTSARERKKLYIFSHNGDSGKSSSGFLALSLNASPKSTSASLSLKWSSQ